MRTQCRFAFFIFLSLIMHLHYVQKYLITKFNAIKALKHAQQ